MNFVGMTPEQVRALLELRLAIASTLGALQAAANILKEQGFPGVADVMTESAERLRAAKAQAFQ